MPGLFWYIALAIIGAGITVFVIMKKKEPAFHLCFFLFAAMAAVSGEAMVLGLLEGYRYTPGAFPDYFMENIIGHTLPNLTLWPATALTVAVFSLRVRWFLAIAAAYMLIDILFQRLGIYNHHWWGTWMTGAAIFAFCILTKYWYVRLRDTGHRFIKFVTLIFILWIILMAPSIPLVLLGMQFYSPGWFGNKYRDSIIFSYYLDMALATASVYFLHAAKVRHLRFMPFLIAIAGDLILYRFGMLSFGNGWSIYFQLLARAVCLLLYIIAIRKFIKKLSLFHRE